MKAEDGYCPDCGAELVRDECGILCPACGWDDGTRYTREDYLQDQADLAWSSGELDEWGRWR